MTEKQSDIVTYIVSIAVILVLFLLFSGCKTQRIYVPVEKIRTEYKDRLQHDSVYLYDSIFVKMTNDTVRLEKYKYLYRDKLVRDSIFVNDTIQVPYPVVEYKEVNRLNGIQTFLIRCGVVSIFMLLIFIVIKAFRLRG